MELKNKQSQFLTEIALMALTYRVSYDSLAKLFNTTIEDVQEALRLIENFDVALYYLDEETKLEDDINKKVAYVKAHNYWIKRNKILKNYGACKTEEEKRLISIELKEHRKLIDDSIAMGTLGKYYLKLEQVERDAIARYRLKYSLPVRYIHKKFGRDDLTIKRFEEDLASRDEIYKEKLEELNNYFECKNKNYMSNKRK